ncbi:MAG TPA: hypothetical protein VK470_00760 [Bacteroidota bacterium]|nr:hypothetical protein [Bacteroidota bacterium]
MRQPLRNNDILGNITNTHQWNMVTTCNPIFIPRGPGLQIVREQ